MPTLHADRDEPAVDCKRVAAVLFRRISARVLWLDAADGRGLIRDRIARQAHRRTVWGAAASRHAGIGN